MRYREAAPSLYRCRRFIRGCWKDENNESNALRSTQIAGIRRPVVLCLYTRSFRFGWRPRPFIHFAGGAIRGYDPSPISPRVNPRGERPSPHGGVVFRDEKTQLVPYGSEIRPVRRYCAYPWRATASIVCAGRSWRQAYLNTARAFSGPGRDIPVHQMADKNWPGSQGNSPFLRKKRRLPSAPDHSVLFPRPCRKPVSPL